ncbi:hypothetical protein MauCBS54593_007405 [Microsporum audouinii]
MDPSASTSIPNDDRPDRNAARPTGEGQSEPTTTQQTPVRGTRRVVSDTTYQRLVFTDPVAYRYLEEDPCTVTVSRRLTLSGYQVYIVEQWACSRVHPTFVINTYTGDKTHTVVVGVLSVPVDEKKWTERVKVYFNAMAQFHARKQETSLGTVMVTNLSTFPSMLTAIPVPDGDVKLHREDFIVNENLKRLGCSGRAGLTVKPPAADTEAKFHQLYQTCDRIQFYTSVKELVRLCQLALVMFDKLAPEYADGLLCDVTERAINDWWTEVGTDHFNIEPVDGILGPTTVSAIVGFFMGARNRLHAYGAPVSKDPFDIPGFEKGVGGFQKAQGLDRTRRLDTQTLDRLHRVTVKAASGERGLQRAMKSTVAELGGKGGEMVMEIVGGGKDKPGISDVETCDFDRFLQLITGDHAKWLWRGKPAKPLNEAQYDTGDEIVFAHDRHGGYVWTRKKRDDHPPSRLSIEADPWRQAESQAALDDKDQLRLTLKRSVTNKVSDARAGLGRFRDAVGLPALRPHHHKRSKESVDLEANLPPQLFMTETATRTSSKDGGPEGAARMDSMALSEASRHDPLIGQTGPGPSTVPEFGRARTYGPSEEDTPSSDKGHEVGEVDGTPGGSEKADGKYHDVSNNPVPVTRVRRRAGSLTSPQLDFLLIGEDAICPRRLSFSYVEEYVLGWEEIGDIYSSTLDPDLSLAEAVFYEDMITADTRDVGRRIRELGKSTAGWVGKKVATVEEIEKAGKARAYEIQAAYERKLEEFQRAGIYSRDVMAQEEEMFMETVRHVEMIDAKLDYEVDSLRARVEEAEAVLQDYCNVIINIESRTTSVMDGKESEDIPWLEWIKELWSRQFNKFEARTLSSSKNGEDEKSAGSSSKNPR